MLHSLARGSLVQSCISQHGDIRDGPRGYELPFVSQVNPSKFGDIALMGGIVASHPPMSGLQPCVSRAACIVSPRPLSR